MALPPTSPPKMRLGIAGLGVAGALVLPEIAAHPNVQITAGADTRAAARDAFAAQFQAEAYASVEAMCASPNVDVVNIVTPNRSHAEHAIVAAEHGKQVMRSRAERRHAFFGLTIVSCERGDVRQTPTGLAIYGVRGRQDISVSGGPDYAQRYTSAELDMMYAAWSTDNPLPSHDGRWAEGTLEVCLAILQSARERREIVLAHQVPFTRVSETA